MHALSNMGPVGGEEEAKGMIQWNLSSKSCYCKIYGHIKMICGTNHERIYMQLSYDIFRKLAHIATSFRYDRLYGFYKEVLLY